GDKATEPFFELIRLADHFDHHVAQAIEFILLYAAGMLTAGEIRIAVMLAAQIVFKGVIREAADQITSIRPAEANGIVQRGLMGEPVVREAWRDIKNVPGRQIFIDNRGEG